MNFIMFIYRSPRTGATWSSAGRLALMVPTFRSFHREQFRHVKLELHVDLEILETWTSRLHPRLRRPCGKVASLIFITWENGCLPPFSPSRQRPLFSSAFRNRRVCSGSSGRHFSD